MDEVNWLINQNLAGKDAGSGYGSYTSGDIQMAIWHLLGEDTAINNAQDSVGSYSQFRVNQLVVNISGCSDQTSQ